jgi:hypothetical protein
MDYVQIVTAEDWGLVAIVPPTQSKEMAPPPPAAQTYVRPQIPKLSKQEPLARLGEAVVVNRPSGREILKPIAEDFPPPPKNEVSIASDGNLLYVPGADLGLPNIMTRKNNDRVLMGFGR